jgi:molybdenum cofactor cytidylyltransferase
MPPDVTGAPARIAALLLAAGSSSRLGSNKLLVELEGEPLVRRAARRALAAGLDPVIAVLGHEAKRIRGALQGLPVTLVGNPRHAAGMATSFHTGIAAVPEACSAALVLLPDMPLVTAAMIAEVAERFRTTGAPLVISLYGQSPAPPTLYARGLFPAALAAEEGGRQVIREHRHLAAEVRWPEELMLDLDLPDDLERLRGMTAGDR